MTQQDRTAVQYHKMTETPIPRLILSLAAPTILSMLITSIYNLADTFFVGRISTSASGAVGVVSSLMAIIQALGFMLGHGSGTIISRRLGSQDTHAATRFASTSFFTALAFGVVLAVVGLATLPDFMMLLGSTETILPHACAYARPILLAAPLMISSLVMNNILRYEGKANLAMVGLVTGGLLNIAARSYGDAAVAGMSIVSRIFMFILSVAIGVGQGLQPVASFNYGARKYHRVRQAAVFTLKAAFALLVVLIAVCWWNDENLIRLFRDDPAVTAVALPAFRYQCFAILLQPVIVVTNMTFQSVGKAGRATFLACCRQGVCFIPLILVLPRVLGLVGVELCQPIADALTFFISLPFLLAFLRQLEQMDKAEASHAPAQL